MNTQQRNRPSKLLTVCPCILGNELGERLAFFGITANFVNYLKRLGAPSVSAAATVNAWTGCCYLFPLLGGWIADSILGRFKTIFVFSIVYLIGSGLLTASAAIPGINVDDGDDANDAQWTLLAICLLLLAIGAGGLKPNVSSFGADQFDDSIERDRKEKQSFFNWFYFFINIGTLIAITLIVYIQDQNKWALGFGIPSMAQLSVHNLMFSVAVILFLAVALFFIGKPKYKILPPSKSTLNRLFKVTAVALLKIRRSYVPLPDWPEDDQKPKDGSMETEMLSTKRKHWEQYNASGGKQHWLDGAIGHSQTSLSYSCIPIGIGGITAEQVNDVKLVYGILPFFFLTITSNYGILPLLILQGEQMDRDVSLVGIHFKMPAASMFLFHTISAIALIPIYEFLLRPALKRYINYKPTMLQRVGAGIMAYLLSLLSIYFIEWRRLHLFNEGRYRPEENEGDGEIVEMSIWWQMVPYSLAGISEVLALVGLTEFYYDQAPDSMRSTMSSINLFGFCLSGYYSTVVLLTVNAISSSAGNQWVRDNLNEGHLDYYLLLAVGGMATLFLLFLWISMRYQYKDVSPRQLPHAVDGDLVMTELSTSITHRGEQIKDDTNLRL